MPCIAQRDGLALQPLLEFRVTLSNGDVADGIPQGTTLADDDTDFLGTGDSSVDKVALEHDVVGKVDGDDDDGIFAALTLVDGRGVGKAEFIKLCRFVFHLLTVEADGERTVFHVDGGDESDVTVEHFLGVVVLELQHAVALAEREAGTGEAVARGVDTLLDGHVQAVGTDGTALHGREHLDAAPRYVVGLRQAVADQVDDGRGYLLRTPRTP
jgi:hypothetical protein